MSEYQYLIVPSQGMYGSGEDVQPVRRSNLSLRRVRLITDRMTRQHQASMRPYGGSSGGYRVIESASWTYGADLDRIPDAS